MSNNIFPISLPGLSISVSKTPIWSTQIQKAVSGRETRLSMYSYPRWRFSLSFEFLRDNATDELRTLVGLFLSCQGAFGTLLLEDESDNAVVDQNFGQGDGSTTSFQLVRTLGGFTEPVLALKSTPTIYVGGVETTDFTMDQYSGTVEFNTAPANGAALSWDGGYYFRVRFADDEMEVERFLHQVWQAKSIELISVKP